MIGARTTELLTNLHELPVYILENAIAELNSQLEYQEITGPDGETLEMDSEMFQGTCDALNICINIMQEACYRKGDGDYVQGPAA